jgi:hypothetical protein
MAPMVQAEIRELPVHVRHIRVAPGKERPPQCGETAQVPVRVACGIHGAAAVPDHGASAIGSVLDSKGNRITLSRFAVKYRARFTFRRSCLAPRSKAVSTSQMVSADVDSVLLSSWP